MEKVNITMLEEKKVEEYLQYIEEQGVRFYDIPTLVSVLKVERFGSWCRDEESLICRIKHWITVATFTDGEEIVSVKEIVNEYGEREITLATGNEVLNLMASVLNIPLKLPEKKKEEKGEAFRSFLRALGYEEMPK